MNAATKLIDSISGLLSAVLWPLLVAALLYMLRSEISDLFRRITKVSAGPFDVSVAAAQRLEQEQAEDAKQAESIDVVSEAPAEPLSSAEYEPRARLLALTTEIDRELRRIFSVATYDSGAAVRDWKHLGRLPADVAAVIRDYAPIRNIVVQGKDIPQKTVREGIDLGESLLEVLRRTPVVAKTGLDLFDDADGTKRLADVHGILVETSNANGTKQYRVFPTRREYRIGDIPPLEFNSARDWGRTWHRDPDSGEIKKAFNHAYEFVGEPPRSTAGFTGPTGPAGPTAPRTGTERSTESMGLDA